MVGLIGICVYLIKHLNAPIRILNGLVQVDNAIFQRCISFCIHTNPQGSMVYVGLEDTIRKSISLNTIPDIDFIPFE